MTFDTDAINNIKFTQGFRGYDTAEVDEFLDDMIREIEKLNNTIKNLKEDVAKEKRKCQLNQQEIDRLTEMNESLSVAAESVMNTPVEPPKPRQEELQPVIVKKPSSMEDIKGTPEYEEMKQILTDTLLSAQQHAEKLVKDAQSRANKLVEDGERKAKDRVIELNVEIDESQNKLKTIKEIVSDVKQRYKRDFQNQIAALDSIKVFDEVVEEDKIEEIISEEKIVQPEPKEQVIAKHELPPVDDLVSNEEPVEEPIIEEKVEEQENTPEVKEAEVNTFDFAAVKKSFASEEPVKQAEPEPEVKSEPEAVQAQPNTTQFDGSANVEDENQQYIELALSAYNDNKHHNTDYPNPPSNIKIDEDDEEGGIYQPENRSVLSSVIEEILNNKRNED